MKKLIGVLIAACILSCSIVKNKQSETNGNGLRIELSRGGCYGTCPIYTLSLNKQRLVKYHGKRFVESQGIHEWYLSRLDYKNINLILSRKEFSKSIDYNMRVQDLAETNLTVYSGNDTIQINHKGEIPQNLKTSIKELESLLMKGSNWEQ